MQETQRSPAAGLHAALSAPKTSFRRRLLAAYLGGAVAIPIRIGSPLFSHVLSGVYLGVLVWGGLVLRDPRLRALLRFAG